MDSIRLGKGIDSKTESRDKGGEYFNLVPYSVAVIEYDETF